MYNINSKKVKKFLFVSSLLIIMLFIIIPIVLNILPKFLILLKTGKNDDIVKYLRSFGIEGMVVLLVLQIFQVLSFIIPAPSIWIISGLTYGTIKGSLTCIIGVIIGNAIAFCLGRKFGNKLINILVNKKNIDKLNFLENSKHPALILFVLYLIPIIPNSIIPYIYARTNISLRKFTSIMSIACIPSILFSTYAGDSAITGNIAVTLIIISLAIILFFIILNKNKKIMHWIERLSLNKK